MKNQKKYQIFLSSTYLDLIEERETAVEAIVKMGHIPAGMELFKAGKSQWQTITKWIDESDIYVLILGGRYGTLNEIEGKSYTQLEYEYALLQGKPVFALVLTKEMLDEKLKKNNDTEILEQTNIEKYKKFKKKVESKIVKYINDIKDIKIELPDNVRELENTCHLEGWSKGNSTEEIFKHMKQNIELLEENKKLKEKIFQLENKLQKSKDIGILKSGLSYLEMKEILEKTEIEISAKLLGKEKEEKFNLLNLFQKYISQLSAGVNNSYGINEISSFIFWKIASPIASYGLAVTKKGTGNVKWSIITLNDEGKKFYSFLQNQKFSN